MPFVDLVDKMDLEEGQKRSLREIVVKSFLTAASFKKMTNNDLRDCGFPLPAILELRELIDSSEATLTPSTQPLSQPSSSSNAAVHTPGSSSTMSESTPVKTAVSRTFPVAAPTLAEIKEKTEHLALDTNQGMKEFKKILVEEMIKVIESLIGKNFFSFRFLHSPTFFLETT